MRPAYLTAFVLLVACDRTERAAPPSQAPGGTPAARRAAFTPPFNGYGVVDTSLGRSRPAMVDVSSAPYGRLYRTKLREGAATGPNFAGHYTVVQWGCGTGCQVVSVVDARTGRLSDQTLLTAGGVEYRRDSRLLYADPPTLEQPPNCASCGTPALYEWRDGRFQRVGTGPHPHIGGPRPWAGACASADTFQVSSTGPYTCPQPR